MIRKFRHIISVFFLVAFLLPSVIMFEHHHQYDNGSADSHENIHEFHQNCLICQFEFSVFHADIEYFEIPKEAPEDSYSNQYSFVPYSNLLTFSFQLRGPPEQQI
ncbi:MAG: hypothetical protein Q8O72_06030 [Bacteroidales bacterium]|jgi:hypothetical protein|nr:hypothetical protein [Bacteroidales bacterium]